MTRTNKLSDAEYARERFAENRPPQNRCNEGEEEEEDEYKEACEEDSSD